MTGFDNSQLINQSIKLIIPSFIMNTHQHYVCRYLSSGYSKLLYKSNKVWIVHKDGHIIPVLLIMKPVVNLSKLKFYITVYIDTLPFSNHQIIIDDTGIIRELDLNIANKLRIRKHLEKFKKEEIPIYLLCPEMISIFKMKNQM